MLGLGVAAGDDDAGAGLSDPRSTVPMTV